MPPLRPPARGGPNASAARLEVGGTAGNGAARTGRAEGWRSGASGTGPSEARPGRGDARAVSE